MLDTLVQDYSVAITTFFVGWVLYFVSHLSSNALFPSYRKLSKGKQAEWCSRVVSNINAVVTTYGALNVLATHDFGNLQLTGWNNLGGLYVQILLGYFTYDFILVLSYKELRTPSTLIHHSLGILDYGLVCYTKQALYFAMLWMATELTTPFVNTRWFLYVTNQSKSTLYALNGLAMTLIFLCWRVGYIPYLGFSALYNSWAEFPLLVPAMKVFVLVSLPGITLLNAYWTSLMIRGIFSLLKKGDKKKEAGKKVAQEQEKSGKEEKKVRFEAWDGEAKPGEVRRRGERGA